MIRVAVADDQELVRAGFLALLDADPGLEVAGEAGDGPAAVVAGFEDSIHPVALDVTDGPGVERAVREAIARFGRIDAVINNAGYGLYGPFEDLSEDEVRREFDTNLFGQWRVARAVLPHMRERGRGKIINVSSLSGQVASPMMGFYAASKHAVEAMSEALAGELDRVVGSPVQVPLTIVGDAGEVAVPPHVGPTRPVRLEVALGVVPQPARHAGPRLRAHQLADRAA